MARSEELYLRDMMQCVELIYAYVKGRSFDEFLADEMFRDAVIRHLEIIGEAAAHLGMPIRERYPESSGKMLLPSETLRFMRTSQSTP